MSTNHARNAATHCTVCGSENHSKTECLSSFVTVAKWLFIAVLSIVVGVVIGS